MDPFRAIDGYCERTDPSYWAEPLNAVTNAAFLVAAALCWRMTGRDAGARILVVILAAIGVGSYLFHTHAQVWAAVADVLPIQAFILVYIGLSAMRFFGAPWWGGIAAALAFVPASAFVSGMIVRFAGPMNGSAGYMPVLLLIIAYAAALSRTAPATARAMATGAAILAVSLTFRTVDAAACAAVPTGTHFLWHVLNAILLGWMIRALVRHPRPALAPVGPPR